MSSFLQWGQEPKAEHYASLEARWINREYADANGIRWVDSITAQQMFGQKRSNIAGLIIPNCDPRADSLHVRSYRLRLDNPPLERKADGTLREQRKYVQAPGRPNQAYFPVGTTVEELDDSNTPLLITEGEFKSIAARRLAKCRGNVASFVAMALAGVDSFRGTVGKAVGPNGERRDVKGLLPDIERIVLKGRRVIVAYDADAAQNPRVRAARWRLKEALVERGAVVGFLEWAAEEGKGLDDWIATVGPDKVLAAIADVSFDDWRSRFIRNETGRLIACCENASLLLENSQEWSGVIGYNEFTGGLMVLRQPPAPVTAAVGSEITDTFDIEVLRWLERKGLFLKPSIVRLVVDALARRNPFHPIQEYLNGLPAWDGRPRIGSWLIDYCGVESSDERPNLFAMAVGRRFLIGCVARVRQPGCKVDTILVLEGGQGLGKSSVVRVLAGDEFFSDQPGEPGTKDCSMALRGVWLMEFPEFDFGRREMSRMKAHLSQQNDRFRLPYGHRIIEMPRQCCFIGTTNRDTWSSDETGGRRFWPVRCTAIDLAALKRDRDQLWAEALVAYDSGEAWWIDDRQLIAEAVEEQRGRYSEDVWQDRVMEYATDLAAKPMSAPCGFAAIPDILSLLGVDVAKQDQVAANRVARCLKAGGWERFQKRDGDKRIWRYRPAGLKEL